MAAAFSIITWSRNLEAQPEDPETFEGLEGPEAVEVQLEGLEHPEAVEGLEGPEVVEGLEHPEGTTKGTRLQAGSGMAMFTSCN